MFNLVLERADDLDQPVWERDRHTEAPDEKHPSPSGPADIHTWQLRRLRLFREGDRIVDALVCNGDRVDLSGQSGRETMAAWRIAASGRLKGSVMPVGHQLDRALWRGLESTLRTVTRPDSAAQEKEHR